MDANDTKFRKLSTMNKNQMRNPKVQLGVAAMHEVPLYKSPDYIDAEMTESQNGGKRPREEAHNKPLESASVIALSQHPPAFISGLTLSQHPPEQRKDLFLMKCDDVVKAMSLHPTDFEGYTIRERFAKMGWEQLLNFSCDKIYTRVVIQWTASLSRNGDELTGIVDGKSYTITPKNIRDFLEVDTRTDLPYVQFKEADLQANTDENRERWLEACATVFGIHENARKTSEGYGKSKMNPLVKILWEIGVKTFHPRLDKDMKYVKAREIYLLHALFTGKYLYSFAHLMIDDIWDMYEHEHRKTIPHGSYISEILSQLGAVPKEEYTEDISPQFQLISRKSFFLELEFTESPTEYIIDDVETQQRVTFPKKFKQGKTSREPLPQIPVVNQHMDMSNLQHLANKQSSQSEKQLNELVTMITNLQKQMEGQASEAKRHEEERENWLIKIQKQIEHQVSEAKCREEREKSLVTKLHKQMELQATESKRREQETETQAEERVKYIVSNIQKQMERQEEERDKRDQEREEWMVSRIQKHMDSWLEGRDRAQDREKEFVTNIQKQMELHASEARCREQEREKTLVTSIQNQMELHALEAKGHEEVRQKLLLTNLQQHMEQQALEAKCREEERDKLLATNLQKQLDLQGLEAKRQEQERQKLADEKDKYIFNNIQKQMKCQEEEREKQAGKREERMLSCLQKLLERQAVEAERREQERERRAEIRTHAIIWDIERQRHFHEQEQDQLRIAWNQFNGANGLNEFQFPHMSHISFHPPGVESKYYDLAQGNEIPKEFKSLFSNIYGPRL